MKPEKDIAKKCRRRKWSKDVREMRDRSKRHRAQQCLDPAAPKICHFCGRKKQRTAKRPGIIPHHLNGNESDNSRENLLPVCYSCNIIVGHVLARHNIGVRTRQFNPAVKAARNLAQWLIAVRSMKGEISTMSVRDAVSMVRATPAWKRSKFAEEIWAIRRQHGTTSPGTGFGF